ncbi:hypothetical protein [Arthrobacter sp. ISL-95]|uniref:hypothetical protein n=1 Tax=Arthrobacter sp. ISL-95 TaxID=2819116 RepID=UPI001BE92D6A|nr:hypothetical protein [Arthrobacter sp. ISL-95]MBT2587914.1 hypothetical protein [Arthrobacter sp. ISL-95]
MNTFVESNLGEALDALQEAAEEGARNYVRPDWRQVNIALLAGKLYAAFNGSYFHDVKLRLENNPRHVIEAWEHAAAAAVHELIDKPDREFQAQLEAVLNADSVAEPTAAREWREAKASDWL